MDRYAVIGNPVAHSLSPDIHRRFALQTAVSMRYERLEAPLDGFAATARGFLADGGRGFNVTVPFKEQAADWVAHLEPAAALAHAVNTVALGRDALTVGHNTDGLGLVRDLHRILGERRGLKVLVLGAGGAARGIVGPLLNAVAGDLVIANRTPSRAEALLEHLGALAGTSAVARPFDAVGSDFDLVVNATAAGLEDRVPAIAPAAVRGAFCYDLVYGRRTAFCRWAERSGARGVADGLGMLVEQAALAFEIWHGVLPDTAPVLAALREERA